MIQPPDVYTLSDPRPCMIVNDRITTEKDWSGTFGNGKTDQRGTTSSESQGCWHLDMSDIWTKLTT